jgi:hypothetical protein
MRQNDHQMPQSRDMNQLYGGNNWHSQSQVQPLSHFDIPATYMSPTAMQKQPEQDFENFIDDAAFERAFDAARIGIAETEAAKMSGGQQEDTYTSDSRLHMGEGIKSDAEAASTYDLYDSSQPIIGSEVYLNETPQEEHNMDMEHEADELARTAGQLLDNLKHERSQKFQNSTFLALMRQLRDKEVRVEGDQMVDVSSNSPMHVKHNHPGPAELITCRVLQCGE